MSEQMTQYMDNAEKVLLHTYNRFPVTFEKGEGVCLYDTDGKKYLDFASGIGVMGLGYGNREYADALKSQIDKITHVSNLFYSTPLYPAADRLRKASGMDRIFFTNSGTEAIEGAMKAAKKFGYTRDGVADHEIIAFNNSFHGRSLGALSVTGTKHYRDPFEKLIPGISFADFNDIDSVNALVTDKTIAVIVEPIQGEGGINVATPEFMKGLDDLRKKGILLIFDEVQCGMGRSGSMFAFQEYGIKPDILVMAKALGCGVPVGAFALTEEIAEKSLCPGDHGTTYGGNPFVCAAVDKVLEIYERDGIVAHVNEVAPVFEKCLNDIAQSCECVEAVKGKGLIRGLKLKDGVKAADVMKKGLEEGIVLLTAEGNVLRMLPPLVMSAAEIEEGCVKIKEILM
ncbi:MAG: acetylornithine/succinylornithine family transaminase [Eubacterium sp.]|nr:acetylornithine/succinylornithine family transaminase [Eubacterium sp.]